MLVILFAADPGRGDHYSRYIRTMASRAPAPATTFTRVAPGRYLIAAIPDADVDFPAQPGVLEKLRPFARPITVVAGETTKVALRVERPSRGR